MSLRPRNLPAVAFLSALTLLVLWPPLAAVGLLPGQIESFEKRSPAPPPSGVSSLAGLERWPRSFETFFDDHLPNRGVLLRLNAWTKYNLFATSPTPAVLIGRHGWLFHAMTADLLEASGRRELSQAQTRLLRIVLEERHDALAEHGIDYMVLVTPTKQTLYPEKLPRWLATNHQRRGRRERLLSELKRTNSPVVIADFTPALAAAKQRCGEHLYFRHDSHWTYQGAFEAYVWLARQYPQWFGPPGTDWVAPPVTNSSNLMNLMGLPGTETSAFPQPPGGFLAEQKHLDTKWLQNLSARCDVQLFERPGVNDRVLYFLQDSFAKWNVNYLATNFSRTILLNPWDARLDRFAQFPLDHMRAEKSRLVVQQMIENRLDVAPAVSALLADSAGNNHPPTVRAARLRRLFAGGQPVESTFRQQGRFVEVSSPQPLAPAFIVRVEIESSEPCLLGSLNSHPPETAATSDPCLRNFELTWHPVTAGRSTAIICASPAADSASIRLGFDNPGARVIGIQVAAHPDVD
jgi:hypothetical protein